MLKSEPVPVLLLPRMSGRSEQKHFIYNSWHMSGAERKLHDQDCVPIFHFSLVNVLDIYYRYLEPDVAIMQVTRWINTGLLILVRPVPTLKPYVINPG